MQPRSGYQIIARCPGKEKKRKERGDVEKYMYSQEDIEKGNYTTLASCQARNH